MSFLFFIDESGHDHQNCPYEVRGGIVLHASKLWSFIQEVSTLEEACFGAQLSEFQVELKGSRLLERKRFRHATQGDLLNDLARRKHALTFLQRGKNGTAPTEIEFRAFGQACLEMSRGIFRLLQSHGGKVFAAVVPRTARNPHTSTTEEFLRKDQVFLLERYFNYIHREKETGLLVFDQTDATSDRKFLRQIERYFLRTAAGRFRATAIVPVPIFVSSELTRAIQAADVCIYALNWGLRRKEMNAECRQEISEEFAAWLTTLEARGHTLSGKNTIHWSSIVFVAEPYGSV